MLFIEGECIRLSMVFKDIPKIKEICNMGVSNTMSLL